MQTKLINKQGNVVLLLAFIIFAASLSAQSNEKKLIVKQINTKIEVDGAIDAVWSEADSVFDFIQLQPYPNTAATRQTVAKVLTTDESIYCLIKCFDNPDEVQKNNGMQDQFGGDVVSFMFDSFNDKKSAYKFAVSASGVKSDSRLIDDARNRDYNWDGVWFADSKFYDWGYVIEMEIPYRTIQYDKNLSEWGLDFDRWIPHLNEDMYWNEYDKNEGQRISKFGKLIFENFKPQITGMNLEIYPVGITKATYLGNGKYKFDPDAGIDIFYNPSAQLTFQLTGNPDFAQIEADPFNFNISRYESYFRERRPFFTEGNEIFMAAGKDQNSGFYQPLELFYSRRIGRKLPDGKEVPLLLGSKVFGRSDDFEYGGFLALTDQTDYSSGGLNASEPRAYFASARVKKNIFGNSNIGFLYVGKYTKDNTYGVLDIDGAFRSSNWQLSYQFARSVKNSEGDFAFSGNFNRFTEDFIVLSRARYIGEKFDIDQIGFVPWRGTWELTPIAGPIWYFDEGYIRQILTYGGFTLNHNKQDDFTDYAVIYGFNMQFRNFWGYEITLSTGKSKDLSKEFTSQSLTLSSWFHTNPIWNGNLYGGYEKTYNFSRDYLAFYSWWGMEFSYKISNSITAGTSINTFIEGNPGGSIEDITYNSRPYFSITPINNLNIRIYVDNVYVKSSDKLEQMIAALLFAYNFSPKSWIYFAINEVQDRRTEFDSFGNPQPLKLHTTSRASALKIKYLYYF